MKFDFLSNKGLNWGVVVNIALNSTSLTDYNENVLDPMRGKITFKPEVEQALTNIAQWLQIPLEVILSF